jgi:hypothetical protein
MRDEPNKNRNEDNDMPQGGERRNDDRNTESGGDTGAM